MSQQARAHGLTEVEDRQVEREDHASGDRAHDDDHDHHFKNRKPTSTFILPHNLIAPGANPPCMSIFSEQLEKNFN